jgi:hypothetical protein
MVGEARKKAMPLEDVPRSFAGREFAARELELIREVVASCEGLSRAELAKTVCELLGWRRRNGSLKGLECRQYLEQLAACGYLCLPAKRRRRPPGSSIRVPKTREGEAGALVEGSVEEFGPVVVQEVGEVRDRELFRELVGRYHYRGYTVAYGAQLCYLVFVSQPQRRVVGCLRFSSPAWRMSARDRWIGWDESARSRNLQRVVNNSRFLLLPWVRIRNLASRVLSQSARQVVVDWRVRYGVEPVLLETLVDAQRFSGTCYRAANWIEVGETTGRGRMDRAHERHGVLPKKVLIYPLCRDAARRLRES